MRETVNLTGMVIRSSPSGEADRKKQKKIRKKLEKEKKKNRK